MSKYFAAAAIIYLLIMTFAGQHREFPHGHGHIRETSHHGLFEVPAEAITQLLLKSGDQAIRFSRVDNVWYSDDRAIQAEDLSALLNEFCQMLTAAEPVRTFQPEDLVTIENPYYGFLTSQAGLQAKSSDGKQITLEFGYTTPDGGLNYVRKKGDPALYVMSGFLFEQFEHLIKLLNPMNS